jgi:hypothetical protein
VTLVNSTPSSNIAKSVAEIVKHVAFSAPPAAGKRKVPRSNRVYHSA